MKNRIYLAALMSLALSLSASAQIPASKGTGYGQAGTPIRAGRQQFAAAGTEEVLAYVSDAAGTRVTMCLPFGTLFRWKPQGGEANCVATMAPIAEVTLADTDTENACRVVDSQTTADGDGVCQVHSAGEVDDFVMPTMPQAMRAPGARPGLCTNQLPNVAGFLTRRGCDEDGDCTPGTCDLAFSDNEIAGYALTGCVYVICNVDTNDAYIAWEIVQ